MFANARPLAKRCLSAAMLFALAGLAQAELPPALDRTPATAQVTVAVKNVGQLDTRLKGLMTSLGADQAELGVMGQLISLPGLNKDGSAAISITQPPADPNKNAPGAAEGGHEKPHMVAILPVSDYAGFLKGLGTVEGQKLTLNDELGGRTYYVKDIGGGFAAMAQSEDELKGFEGKAGNKAAQEKLLGKVGSQISDSSDAIVIANIDSLRPMLEEGLKGMREQTEMMVQMAGPQGEQLKGQLEMMQGAADSFLKDASVGIMGLGINDSGVSMDFGAQFKEGTECAKMFNAKGDTGAVLTKLPTQPYYFAFAGDFSNPGIKQLFRDALAKQQAAANKDGKLDDGTLAMIVRNIDHLNTFGMVMGASPAGLMGGLFANTTYYAGTTKPADFVASQKATMEALNDKTMEGITYKTTYTAGATTVENVKADQWSMQMNVDPNNPAAMQIQQMQSMLFGMGGLSGYIAPVDNGVVSIMSQNTPLLTSAIKAAKEGKGLGDDALLKDAQKNLPEGRSFEGYVGVKALIDTASGFMAMMGGGTAYQTPPQVAPIAMGGTTSDGGLRMKVFVPSSTMKTIGDFGKSFQGMMGEDGGDAPAGAPENKEKGKAPRF